MCLPGFFQDDLRMYLLAGYHATAPIPPTILTQVSHKLFLRPLSRSSLKVSPTVLSVASYCRILFTLKYSCRLDSTRNHTSG